jgi:hypothetical protein
MKDPRKLGRLALGCGLGAMAVLMSTSALAQRDSGRNLYNGPDHTLEITAPSGDSGPAPAGTAAPNTDPHDLNGHWVNFGIKHLAGPEAGVPAPLKPKYMAKLEKRMRDTNSGIPEGDASTQCFPHGTPRAIESPYPVEVIMSPAAHGAPAQVTILMETLHNIRRIYLTDKHFDNMGESFLGESIAHWDGDTLVVDTKKLNTRTFLDDEGSTHSTQEHVVEHIHKSADGTKLEVLSTVTDPVTLYHPYTTRTVLHWRPDIRNQEFICEENNRNGVDKNGITTAK